MNRILLRYTTSIFSILMLTFMGIAISTILNDISDNPFDSSILFMLICIKIPLFIALFMPISYFFAIILTFNQLREQHELVVIRTSGCSLKSLLMLTQKTVLPLTVLLAIVTLWIGPHINTAYHHTLQNLSPQLSINNIPTRQFITLGNNGWVLYAQKPQATNIQSNQLFLAKQSTNNHAQLTTPKWEILTSTQAPTDTHASEHDNHLRFYNGTRTLAQAGNPQLDTLTFSQYSIPIAPNLHFIKPESILAATFTSNLWQDRAHSASLAELGWRLSLIIVPWILTMIALPLSHYHRPRTSSLIQLIPALFIYCSYAVLLLLARYTLTNGMSPHWLNMWWPHAVMLLAVSPWYLFPQLHRHQI